MSTAFSVQPLLASALCAIPSHFKPNELAYLTLTKKPEDVIRDAVSLELRTTVPSGYEVAREWRRCDLVVLSFQNATIPNSGKPQSIVEFKSMYTFDPLINGKSWDHLPMALLKDMKTRRKKFSAAKEVIGVLAATHTNAQIGMPYRDYITKYWEDINRAFGKYANNASAILQACTQQIQTLLAKNGFTFAPCYINAGQWTGVSVEIHFWTIK